MEITRQADYAVRAVLDLALRYDGERAFSDDIARRQNIPPAFLTKILSRLAAEGIVVTQRGVKGGVRLARPAGDITLLHVVEAIDGPITLNRCTRRPGECPRDMTCAVHPAWRAICDRLRAHLAAIDFGSLAASAAAMSTPIAQTIPTAQEAPIADV